MNAKENGQKADGRRQKGESPKAKAKKHSPKPKLSGSRPSRRSLFAVCLLPFALLYKRTINLLNVTKATIITTDSLLYIRAGSNKTQQDVSFYLYHHGKPLVALWGVGFNDHGAYGTKEVEKIVNFLKNDKQYGGCSILLGVPAYWRDLGRDTEKDSSLYALYQQADIIHPWLVGRYNEDSYAAFSPRISADIAWCKQHHVDYVPTIFPGFSWHNMYNQSPMNQTPRNKGQFYWKQIIGAIQSGAGMLYIAMFDEVDEGTAIFKIAKDPPVGGKQFCNV